MKKIYLMFFMISAMGFFGCEGPTGPPGIDGMDGKDGVDGVDGEDGGLFLSTVLETEVNFTEEGNYQAGFNMEINEDDNLLIYVALGVDQEENVVWMPLPQTFFIEQGMILYNFYFTKQYFSIILDSNISPGDLPDEWTSGYFRIVIVPGVYAGAGERIDFSDYNAVMDWLGKKEGDIEKISPR